MYVDVHSTTTTSFALGYSDTPINFKAHIFHSKELKKLQFRMHLFIRNFLEGNERVFTV